MSVCWVAVQRVGRVLVALRTLTTICLLDQHVTQHLFYFSLFLIIFYYLEIVSSFIVN